MHKKSHLQKSKKARKIEYMYNNNTCKQDVISRKKDPKPDYECNVLAQLYFSKDKTISDFSLIVIFTQVISVTIIIFVNDVIINFKENEKHLITFLPKFPKYQATAGVKFKSNLNCTMISTNQNNFYFKLRFNYKDNELHYY